MAINPLTSGNKAEACCDDCGRIEVVPCTYMTRKRSPRHEPNEGQVILKMTGKGWTYRKGRLTCPECETTKKQAKEQNNMQKIAQKPTLSIIPPEVSPSMTEPRQPTREQKRAIMSILEAAYDTKAGRYTGGDTDKTVAEAIGGGVMFGWVADIREEFFGPDGGNAEMDAVLAELKAARASFVALNAEMDAVKETVRRIETDAAQSKERMSRALSRIEAIKAAVGPRASRV